jgi:hypothetical protein
VAVYKTSHSRYSWQVEDNVAHEAGKKQTSKDLYAVQRANDEITSHMINPFAGAPDTDLVNIATGEKACKDVCKDLTHVKEIGENALKTCLDTGGSKLAVVKLKTFESQKEKRDKGSQVTRSDRSLEVNILQRVSQVIASGGEVDVEELVGMHECTQTPV